LEIIDYISTLFSSLAYLMGCFIFVSN